MHTNKTIIFFPTITAPYKYRLVSKTSKQFQLNNYFSYTVGHCNEKEKARGRFYKRNNIKIFEFSVIIYFFWKCYLSCAYRENLGNCLLFEIRGQFKKHKHQTYRHDTEKWKKPIKLLKMFSSPFQQQQALCWSPVLFVFIAGSSIIAEGMEYSRTPLIYLTNSCTS